MGNVGFREKSSAFVGHNSRRNGVGRMYAIVFDLDTNTLNEVYPGSRYNEAYSDIRRFLEARGFAWQQGSTYFGNEDQTAVSCVTTVALLTREFPWIKQAVKDIRMLRIEENNDLGPIVDLA